ncbi:isonitrile hydratase [Colletotrichum spaethianum]|uniref:Isonitrile hydratase n=1 Tax=Colletotrichum spaethianum TaxID=700344 RepID=A0AA37LEX1_9PEZI|nr:isonitrile hydratase [Colletotrichum spaethianum]GKT45168.1 isonitrile hydratase [Colletotrichum spaethianum]
MSTIRIASLAYQYQTIDVFGPFDVLSSGSKLVTQLLKEYRPVSDELTAAAPEVEFHHIGVTLDPVELTAGVSIVPTATVDNPPEVDILLLGGPNPATFTLHPKFVDYIRQHVAAGKLLFTNCTGSFVAALTGVLDGRNVTINNAELEWIKKRFPKVNWTVENKWVVDGNIWTAAGAVAGMDMTAHWLKENFGEEVLTLATMGLDFEPRDVKGVLNVIPKRYDSAGNQITTHVFPYYDSY